MRVSEGDLRKAITFLQSAARLSIGKEITEDTITEIAGVIQWSCVTVRQQLGFTMDLTLWCLTGGSQQDD